MLSVFLTAPAKGIDSVLSTREMNFRDFLDRAGAILPDFDADKIKEVKSLLYPRPRVSRAVAASV